jgi:hypothetical protein
LFWVHAETEGEVHSFIELGFGEFGEDLDGGFERVKLFAVHLFEGLFESFTRHGSDS